ncbi:MAG TPA: phosphopantetheine-binding protein [Caulobacteraceae bacterium]|nr:phosphopantetheine-binding protein [Caulobacteraceae bacterium]
MQVTEAQLLDLIAIETLVDRSSLTREAALSDLGITSLDLTTVLFELEEQFAVVIEDGELSMTTVGDMVDLLLRRINANGSKS